MKDPYAMPNKELLVSLVDMKSASIRLGKLATKLDSNKLNFSFNISCGETAEQFLELIQKYNELGKSFSQLVKDVKYSVEQTSDGFKRTDQSLSTFWDSASGSSTNKKE